MPRCTGFLALAAFGLAAASPAPTGPGAMALRATLNESDGTSLEIRFRVDTGSGRWSLYSRPGAVNALIPWHQRLLGSVTGKLPPRGALITAKGSLASAGTDSVLINGQLDSPFLGMRRVAGWMAHGRLHLDLRRPSDSLNIAGTIDARGDSGTTPLRDYAAVAAGVERVITANIYDPELPKRDKLQTFFRRFRRRAAEALDDLDIVAAFQAAKGSLPSSHYGFIRNPGIANAPIDSLLAGDQRVDPASYLTFQLPAPGLAYLQVRRWDRVGAHIDRVFARMEAAKVTTFILDVRGNPGGDNTMAVPLAHLFRDTMPVGTLLSRGAHTGAVLPTVTSETTMRELLDAIRGRGGAVMSIVPRQPYFAGKVFVVTNGRTGSASEPLVHVLKQTKRAVVVGERTGGAMLMALPHPVGDDFIVTVPESDYRTADGVRLEGNGVTPHIRAPSSDALIAVGSEVRKTMPFAGAVWLANVYASQGRTSETRKSLEHALRLAPSDSARASIQRRLDNFRANSSK